MADEKLSKKYVEKIKNGRHIHNGNEHALILSTFVNFNIHQNDFFIFDTTVFTNSTSSSYKPKLLTNLSLKSFTFRCVL